MEEQYDHEIQFPDYNSSQSPMSDLDEDMPAYQVMQGFQLYNPYPPASSDLPITNQMHVEQIIQTPPGFELTEDNSMCKLCYKYATDSVVCNNEKCQILMCLTCSRDTRKKVENKCPFCRVQPFAPTVNPYRTIINKIELPCKLCHQKYILEQEEKHYKLECSFFNKIKCNYCEEHLKKEQIVKHTKIFHEDKIDQIIFGQYTNPVSMPNPSKVLDKCKTYLGQINKSPNLGTSGKFYCGSKLDGPKCSCCNGYCGPTNGQNCSQCMKLDIMRFGLSKGYLVNSQGHICWRQGETFICRNMNYYGSAPCKEGKICGSCRNMTTNVERYKDLL